MHDLGTEWAAHLQRTIEAGNTGHTAHAPSYGGYGAKHSPSTHSPSTYREHAGMMSDRATANATALPHRRPEQLKIDRERMARSLRQQQLRRLLPEASAYPAPPRTAGSAGAHGSSGGTADSSNSRLRQRTVALRPMFRSCLLILGPTPTVAALDRAF